MGLQAKRRICILPLCWVLFLKGTHFGTSFMRSQKVNTLNNNAGLWKYSSVLKNFRQIRKEEDNTLWAMKNAASQAAVVSGGATSRTHVFMSLLNWLLDIATPSPLEAMLIKRIVAAGMIGTMVGLERRKSHRPAGFRTMTLTSVGASIFTITSIYGFEGCKRADQARVAAGVASGVGFIGAGVITRAQRLSTGGSRAADDRKSPGKQVDAQEVRGLTTAAAIWISAALGMACGTGLQRIALWGAWITIFILRVGDMARGVYRGGVGWLQDLVETRFSSRGKSRMAQAGRGGGRLLRGGEEGVAAGEGETATDEEDDDVYVNPPYGAPPAAAAAAAAGGGNASALELERAALVDKVTREMERLKSSGGDSELRSLVKSFYDDKSMSSGFMDIAAISVPDPAKATKKKPEVDSAAVTVPAPITEAQVAAAAAVAAKRKNTTALPYQPPLPEKKNNKE